MPFSSDLSKKGENKRITTYFFNGIVTLRIRLSNAGIVSKP
ncbi:MAG TPA: hypothetical protein VFY68_07365 [Nitrososphaeraceae archaeon]|nr:hypothetical protein [Nitrososphaeraceae archaeon]